MPVPSPRMLRTMRLLLLEEGHCFRDQALSFCEFTRSEPRQIMEGSSLTTLVQLVGAGIGVTLIPEMAIAIESRWHPFASNGFPSRDPRAASACSGARIPRSPSIWCKSPKRSRRIATQDRRAAF